MAGFELLIPCLRNQGLQRYDDAKDDRPVVDARIVYEGGDGGGQVKMTEGWGLDGEPVRGPSAWPTGGGASGCCWPPAASRTW